ncbi:MAG TPA: signal peptidase II [Planctomycetes bacterium]|nr:signal peptidase II [Planctomycetota bacterium]
MYTGISFFRQIPLAFWLLVLLLLGADLWTKAWAWDFAAHGRVVVLGDWLSVQKVTNSGGVFGLGQGLRVPLTLLRSLVVLFLLYLVGKQDAESKLSVPTLGLITAGALGNLWDNFSAWAPWSGNGEVRDFIRVDLGPAPDFWPDVLPWIFDPWPIFNLADSCICVGFVLMVTGLAKIRMGASDAG